jgi:hypothetical protein
VEQRFRSIRGNLVQSGSRFGWGFGDFEFFKRLKIEKFSLRNQVPARSPSDAIMMKYVPYLKVRREALQIVAIGSADGRK